MPPRLRETHQRDTNSLQMPCSVLRSGVQPIRSYANVRVSVRTSQKQKSNRKYMQRLMMWWYSFQRQKRFRNIKMSLTNYGSRYVSGREAVCLVFRSSSPPWTSTSRLNLASWLSSLQRPSRARAWCS